MSINLISLYKDPEWVKSMESKDPLFLQRRAYYLPGKAIRNEVHCKAPICKWEARTAIGISKSELHSELGDVATIPRCHPMMLCFFCNRTFHLLCVDLNIQSWQEEAVPWRCLECRRSCSNNSANDFYASKLWDKGLASRRKALLTDAAIKISPNLLEAQATEEEFDQADIEAFRQSFDSSAYVTVQDFQQQKEETEKVGEALLNVTLERDELLEKIAILEAEKKREEELRKKAESQFESSKLKDSTFDSTFSKSHVSFNVPTSTFYQPKATTMKDIMSKIYFEQSKRKSNGSKLSGNTSTSSRADQYQSEQSFVNESEISQLDLTQRVLLEQSTAQKEATKAQRLINRTMNLEQQRKSLGKISSFNGDARDWIRFKRDIKRYQDIGEYDDSLMKMYVLRALEGDALARVRDMIDQLPLQTTLKVLEDTFGDSTKIIDKCGEDILALRVPKELYKEDVIKVLTEIQKYFAACIYAEVGFENTNILAKHIVEQLNTETRQRYRRHRREVEKDENKLMNLESLFSFLEELMKDLDDRKNKVSHVVASTSIATSSQNENKSNEKPDYFIIYDVKAAKHMGYDLEQLAKVEKKCELCSRSHYTVECKNYYAMSKDKRNEFINQRNLCRNCVVTSSHAARDCKIKPYCGARVKGQRCQYKHHYSLHSNSNRFTGKPFKRRNNTQYNNNRATDVIKNSASNDSEPTKTTTGTTNSNVTQSASSKLQEEIRKKNDVLFANLNSISEEQTTTVKVFETYFMSNGKTLHGHAVGDSASEATLLSEELRRELNLEGESCQINVRWADSTVKAIDAIKVNLELKGVHKNAKLLTLRDCYAVSMQDFALPPRSLDIQMLKRKFKYLKPVKCNSYKNIVPSLLIGGPHAAVIESCGKLYEGGAGKPVGLLAKLGWCIYGGSQSELHGANIYNVQIEHDAIHNESTALSNEQLFDAFSFLNSVENLGLKESTSKHTEDERKAMEIMEEETKILANGSIEVPLVWNRHEKLIPILPNNYVMVMKRQILHEAKLKKNPEHLKIYNEKFQDFLNEGYARPATKEDLEGKWPNINYLPMTLVINKNKIPVGYRIVFDAAAKFQQNSLNNNLLKGPDLLIKITDPVIDMRTRNVAITADVKSMFMQMKINIRDQQCQRVLWRPNDSEDFKTFIFASALFGPTCSPFQSQFCKNLAADAWRDQYPKASSLIRSSVYMDDLLTSIATTEEAIEIAKQCIYIFRSINWELRQFQSNDIAFLKGLPAVSVKQDLIPLMEDAERSCTAKVLGCMWDPRSDKFVFNFDKNLFIKIVKECEHVPTKRDQSSTIARIFDVLGLICHYVIRGRILLQRSWAKGIDWDQKIEPEEHKLWVDWLKDIENIAKLQIPRKLCEGNDLYETGDVSLHLFCDAGAEAYAAVAYLVTSHNNKRSSNIVMARAHVTPLRYKSKTKVSEIPRLELYAALLAARICHTLTERLPNLKLKRYIWSDSEVVLRWIKNPNIPLKAYAKSPIEEILTKTDKSEWVYVPTKLNVADIATKFKKIDFSDSESIWCKGPKFIIQDQIYWPKMIDLSPKTEAKTDEEICVCSIKYTTEKGKVQFESPIKLPLIDDPIADENCISKLRPSIRSTWKKIIRATARGLKLYLDGFIPLVRSEKYNDEKTRAKLKAEINVNILTPYDLERAELFLVRRAQRLSFPEEYSALQARKLLKNKEMLELGIFLDDQGVMRINSRVKLPQRLYPQSFAPFLPRENAYTGIYLRHIHCEFQHIHLESQIAAVRYKYWVPSLRVKLKSIQHACNFCRFLRARPQAPMMAALPECRTDPGQFPFQTTGLDCAGPINVKVYGRDKKIWILIFSCTRTRFIQLHILESLESIRVLEAIATLWSTNGPVQTFISDRGTNFQGASRFIREEYERTKELLFELHGELAEKLAMRYKTEWKFLPAHSPWMGGFYERLIKEVKRSIALTLENKKLTKIELNIALQDACHRINCRPLTYHPISAEDNEILTPHHLARGRPGWPYMPTIGPLDKVDYRTDRSVYRRGRLLADEITRRFIHGYLEVLTKRKKWFNEVASPIKINDLVLLIEPNMTRDQFKRGKVIKLYKAQDRRSRVADVLLANGVVKLGRSIQRLAKIEISDESEEA